LESALGFSSSKLTFLIRKQEKRYVVISMHCSESKLIRFIFFKLKTGYLTMFN